jgi:hypothetical protein
MLLHAASLEFEHPRSSARLCITAPPNDPEWLRAMQLFGWDQE